eukprot:1885223-Rhodomonas_salina.1
MTYPRPPPPPTLTSTDVAHAMQALNITVATDNVYFLDSGASFSIIRNCKVLYNIHSIPPVTIEGLTGA